jgi:hypothetical protein
MCVASVSQFVFASAKFYLFIVGNLKGMTLGRSPVELFSYQLL